MFTAAMLLFCALVLPATSATAATAYRINKLELSDPHAMVQVVLTCVDITYEGLPGVPSVAEILTGNVTQDANNDGLLDASLLLVFDEVNPTLPGGQFDVAIAACSAPLSSTTCVLGPTQSTSYSNLTSGTCLTPEGGTTGPYTPPNEPVAACFVTAEGAVNLSLDLLGIALGLRYTQVAATYAGDDLINGLIKGFLNEAEADTLIIPPEIEYLAGLPFSVLLPGGYLNCAAHDDKDVAPDGTVGWWVYLDFEASLVPFEIPTAVPFENRDWSLVKSLYR